MNSKAQSDSRIESLVAIIGGKWKVPVLWALHDHDRPLRYGELRDLLPRVSSKVLSQVLKELEKDGLIVRREYKERPPRVEYQSSRLGESLRRVLADMDGWARSNLARSRRGT